MRRQFSGVAAGLCRHHGAASENPGRVQAALDGTHGLQVLGRVLQFEQVGLALPYPVLRRHGAAHRHGAPRKLG